MTGLQVELQVLPRPVDGRRSLPDVLQFLADRGVSPNVIGLAMARAGIPVEVSRVLADLVVTSHRALPPPAPMRGSRHDPGRLAQLFLRKLLGVAVTVVLFLGAGLALGFSIGIEIGMAQGFEHGIERLQALLNR
jgi:hypothetical protein